MKWRAIRLLLIALLAAVLGTATPPPKHGHTPEQDPEDAYFYLGTTGGAGGPPLEDEVYDSAALALAQQAILDPESDVSNALGITRGPAAEQHLMAVAKNTAVGMANAQQTGWQLALCGVSWNGESCCHAINAASERSISYSYDFYVQDTSRASQAHLKLGFDEDRCRLRTTLVADRCSTDVMRDYVYTYWLLITMWRSPDEEPIVTRQGSGQGVERETQWDDEGNSTTGPGNYGAVDSFNTGPGTSMWGWSLLPVTGTPPFRYTYNTESLHWASSDLWFDVRGHVEAWAYMNADAGGHMLVNHVQFSLEDEGFVGTDACGPNRIYEE